MIPVESSNIKAVSYNPETKIFKVNFHKKDSLYEYHNFPAETFDEFMKAESKGAFLVKNIIKKFAVKKVR